MNAMDEGRNQGEEPEGHGAEEEATQWHWRPPTRSDQAPGEETVQVNDPYVGGDPGPQEETSQSNDQHQTGG